MVPRKVRLGCTGFNPRAIVICRRYRILRSEKFAQSRDANEAYGRIGIVDAIGYLVYVMLICIVGEYKLHCPDKSGGGTQALCSLESDLHGLQGANKQFPDVADNPGRRVVDDKWDPI